MSPSPITVSELNRRVRHAIESQTPLLWVAGEVSNLTRAASGHLYFSLKDEGAQVRCVMFRSRSQTLPWRLENGQQVEALVRASLYEPRGDFQLNVENLRRGGLGRLFEAFAQLKLKLESEGLFQAARKRPLPRLPRTIGIVSSPQAAALRDILAALRRRAPHVPVVLYPTLVQGEDAPAQIAQAIELAGHRQECDVLLVARGGGSIEDLWAFNEEVVARAIAAAPMPVISGIGHETDFTIADFVADHRAATPTAAAELASAGWFVAAGALDLLGQKLNDAMTRRLEYGMQRLDVLAARLIHPARRLELAAASLARLRARLTGAVGRCLRQAENRLGEHAVSLARHRPALAFWHGRLHLNQQRLQAALARRLTSNAHRLAHLGAALANLNPEATLSRGYSIVRDAQGRIVRDSQGLAPGDTVEIRFAQGNATGRIENID